VETTCILHFIRGGNTLGVMPGHMEIRVTPEPADTAFTARALPKALFVVPDAAAKVRRIDRIMVKGTVTGPVMAVLVMRDLAVAGDSAVASAAGLPTTAASSAYVVRCASSRTSSS
jgi:hypothetical protein